MKYYDVCYRPVIFLLAAGSAVCGLTVMSDVSQWDSYSEVTRRLSGLPPIEAVVQGEAYPDAVSTPSSPELQLSQNETVEETTVRN